MHSTHDKKTKLMRFKDDFFFVRCQRCRPSSTSQITTAYYSLLGNLLIYVQMKSGCILATCLTLHTIEKKKYTFNAVFNPTVCLVLNFDLKKCRHAKSQYRNRCAYQLTKSTCKAEIKNNLEWKYESWFFQFFMIWASRQVLKTKYP